METFASFLVAFAITFFFVRKYVKGLALTKKSGGPAPAVAVSTAPCPRCSAAVPAQTAFCGACGAPMSLWNVHRAAVQVSNGTPGEKGRPRPVINATLCIGCGSCIDACPEAGTLELRGGKAILAHAERCLGHAKCVSACPTSGITLAFGSALQTLKVPSVNSHFETNVPGLFIVGELGGMGLIKTAINEGKLAIEHVRQKLESRGLWTRPLISHDHEEAAAGSDSAPDIANDAHNGPFDVLIAGAGPAGLSASLTAHQCGIRYLTVEQGEIASTIRNYPRHKFLMAEPIEMPLYGSLYIGDSTKEGLLSVWEAILANTGVRVRTNEKLEEIRRADDGGFQVRTSRTTYDTRYVVLALGKRGSPRRLGVPGEELGKVAYRLIEADSYSGNDILIVGGGDSAVEAALATSKANRNRVTLSYRGAEFSRLRERNQTQLKVAEDGGRIRVLRASQVKRIEPERVEIVASAETISLSNDYVFVLIGGESPEELLRRTGIDIVEKVLEAK